MNEYYETILRLCKKERCLHTKYGYVFYKGYIIHTNYVTTQIFINNTDEFHQLGERILGLFNGYIEALIWIDDHE